MEDQRLFYTSETSFASYLLAANLLAYRRAELRGRSVEFAFDDPEGRGEDLRKNWRLGIASLVHPRTMLAARERLIDEVKRVSREKQEKGGAQEA